MSSTSTQDLTALHDEYLRKLDGALDNDQLGLAAELSAGYATEAGLAAPAVRRPSGGRRPSAMRRRSAAVLRRLDRHTLKAYNPSWPHRLHGPRDEQ